MAIIPWRQERNAPTLLPRWFDTWFDEDIWPDVTVRDGLDVYETDNEVVVKAAVPGVSDENVHVTFEDGVMRIQGRSEETDEEKKQQKNVYRQQRMVSFDYTTTLPRSVDIDKITAEVERGVVTVKAPITAASKPK